MSVAETAILIGGGGHAAVVADAARSMGIGTILCLDDDSRVAEACERAGMTLSGAIEELPGVIGKISQPMIVHAAAGGARLRKKWLNEAQELLGEAALVAIIHASAVVSPSARIGAGVFIGPQAVVNARVEIERGAIINSGAIVEHDCVIGPFSHIAPRATLGGGAQVGSMSLIGIGAIVLPGIKIGSETILGAGALARENLPDAVTAFGIPARVASPCQS